MTHFSETLKNRRQELNMTMQAVADRAGVSKSMICKIERDEVQPTIDVASRIARALDKTLSEMLHVPQATSVVFLPKENQAVWEDSNHIKRRNISPVFEGLKLEWLHVAIPPHGAVQKCMAMNAPGVEKYILVINGILELCVNQQVYTLEKGDSIYFDAGCVHEYCNQDNTLVEFYLVVNY